MAGRRQGLGVEGVSGPCDRHRSTAPASAVAGCGGWACSQKACIQLAQQPQVAETAALQHANVCSERKLCRRTAAATVIQCAPVWKRMRRHEPLCHKLMEDHMRQQQTPTMAPKDTMQLAP